jgi:CMP-N,N'-diacetyllegionaminic acid synthase
MQDQVLGIIPARAGSKEIRQKNMKSFAGMPLVAWTFAEAKKCNFFDRLILSSDDPAVIDLADKYHIEVPFIRPAVLASDTAKSIDVVKHALDYYGNKFSTVILLQPTSPLRTAADIKGAFNFFANTDGRAVISVCELECPLEWTATLSKNKTMKPFVPLHNDVCRQKFQPCYRINGAIYIAQKSYLLKNNGFLGKQTFAYIMERDRSIDIDNAADFKIAEFLMQQRIAANE